MQNSNDSAHQFGLDRAIGMGMKGFFEFCGLFALAVCSLTKAAHARPVSCSEYLELLKAEASTNLSQKVSVPLRDGSSVTLLLQDPELLPYLQAPWSEETQKNIFKELLDSGTFDIPVRPNGAVVAAPSAGGYGVAIWIRDLARVFEGLVALGRHSEARQVVLAILQAMSTPDQVRRLHSNIRDTGLHQSPGGEMKVLHIRMSAENFGPVFLEIDGRKIEEGWNHKQNDALALSFLVTEKAFRLGLIREEDLSEEAKQYIAALPTYFERLWYWEMHDGGAWEEWNAVRASSLGLVTRVFEVLRQDLLNPQNSLNPLPKLIRQQVTSGKYPTDILQHVQTSYQDQRLSEVLEYGYSKLRQILARGESPDFDHGHEKRIEDAALAHLFWYPLERLQEKEWQMILGHVEKLVRLAGIPRYFEDAYLLGLYAFNSRDRHEPMPEEFFLTQPPPTYHQLWELFHPRQPERLMQIFGAEAEAQWSIHDPILSYAYLWMFRQYKNPEYRVKAELYAKRSIAAVLPRREVLSTSGTQIPSRKIGEAFIPQRIFGNGPNGQRVLLLELYLPSYNAPLYWPTAEHAIMHTKWNDYFAAP